MGSNGRSIESRRAQTTQTARARRTIRSQWDCHDDRPRPPQRSHTKATASMEPGCFSPHQRNSRKLRRLHVRTRQRSPASVRPTANSGSHANHSRRQQAAQKTRNRTLRRPTFREQIQTQSPAILLSAMRAANPRTNPRNASKCRTSHRKRSQLSRRQPDRRPCHKKRLPRRQLPRRLHLLRDG